MKKCTGSQEPSKDVYKLVKYEIASRKGFKGELNKVKSEAIRKDKIKRKLESLTEPNIKEKGIVQLKEAVTKKKKVISAKRAPKKDQKQNHQELV